MFPLIHQQVETIQTSNHFDMLYHILHKLTDFFYLIKVKANAVQ